MHQNRLSGIKLRILCVDLNPTNCLSLITAMLLLIEQAATVAASSMQSSLWIDEIRHM